MVKNILSGWQNYINKNDVSENLAAERATLCATCPHARQGTLLTFIKDRLTEIEGAYCNICKCPLSAKVRSNDTCPLKKW